MAATAALAMSRTGKDSTAGTPRVKLMGDSSAMIAPVSGEQLYRAEKEGVKRKNVNKNDGRLRFTFDNVRQRLQRQQIRAPPKPFDRPDAYGGGERPAPEFLARLGVRQMALDDRQADGADRVAQGDRGVGVAAGVEDHPTGPGPGIVQGVDQRSLVVRLKRAHLEA